MEMQSYSRSIALLVATLLLTAGLKAKAQSKPETSIKSLTLGAVFQEPREPVEEHFRPLINYVARKLSPSGETKGAVVVAPSATQLMKLLEEKRVDFYIESPYPTYLINRSGGATLLLRRWKGGWPNIGALSSPAKKAASRGSKICAEKLSPSKIRGRPPVIFCPNFF